MRPEFRTLRTNQLDRALKPFLDARGVQRPLKGWIRAIRETTGLTMREVARRLNSASPSLVSALEQSEAEYRITLSSLRDAAEAMDCQLVYALVPKKGIFSNFWSSGQGPKLPKTFAQSNTRWRSKIKLWGESTKRLMSKPTEYSKELRTIFNVFSVEC